MILQSMPAIWGEGSFRVIRGDVLGQLAHWGVTNAVPENLAQGLIEFDAVFQISNETTCGDLLNEIRSTFERCPQILAWDLDLDALARNMAHSITLDRKYVEAQEGTS